MRQIANWPAGQGRRAQGPGSREQASRIFPSAHAREKGGGGRGMRTRKNTLARLGESLEIEATGIDRSGVRVLRELA